MNYKRITLLCGHYGSGKTNIAVNMAYDLKKNYEKVVIADLDIVNPYFRSNDARSLLEANGITVIAPDYAGTNVDIPALPPDIMRIFNVDDAAIVIDVGGDDDGAIALGRYKRFFDSADVDVSLVINTRRPLSGTVEEIIEMKENIELSSRLRVTDLIADTNISDETTKEIIEEGAEIVKEVSERLNIPIKYVVSACDADFSDDVKNKLFKIERKLLKI